MPKRRKNTNTSFLVSNTALNACEKSNRKRSCLPGLHSVSVEDHDYTSKELRKHTREKINQIESSANKGNGIISYKKDTDQNVGGSCNKRSLEHKFVSGDHITGCKGINLVPTMKARCISKNAINARINRLKKKGYIDSLENRISDIKSKNEELKAHNEDQLKCINSLKAEVAYLRGVISNISEIRSLLRTVRHHSNLQVTSSLFKEDQTTSCTKVDTGTSNQHEHFNNITLSDTTGELSKFDETNTSVNFYDNLSCLDTLVDNDILTPLSVDSKFLESTSDFFNGNMEDGLFCSSGTLNSIDVPNIGVCFHVANKRVSLEFCAVCNQNALS